MVIWKAFQPFNVKIKYNSMKYIDVKYCFRFRYEIQRRKYQLKDGLTENITMCQECTIRGKIMVRGAQLPFIVYGWF